MTSTTKSIETRNYETCDIEKVVDRLERKGNFGEAEFATYVKMVYLKKQLADELQDPFGGFASHFETRIAWCEAKLSELALINA